jgi:hypothetical protein
MLKASCLGLAVLLGLALAANGIFMLASPEHWYVLVPGVTSTGPFNQHFLRDIGLIFVFLGGAFLLGTARPQVRVLLWGAAAIWLLGHALFHFWEVAVGICSRSCSPSGQYGTRAPKKAASPWPHDTRELRDDILVDRCEPVAGAARAF